MSVLQLRMLSEEPGMFSGLVVEDRKFFADPQESIVLSQANVMSQRDTRVSTLTAVIASNQDKYIKY